MTLDVGATPLWSDHLGATVTDVELFTHDTSQLGDVSSTCAAVIRFDDVDPIVVALGEIVGPDERLSYISDTVVVARRADALTYATAPTYVHRHEG